MKPGFGGRLLIQPQTWVAQVDSHSNEWITDRYVMARRECFKTLPKSTDPLADEMPKKLIRRVLAEARINPIPGFLCDTKIRAHVGFKLANEAALVRAGSVYGWLNARLWSAWSATGLRPELNQAGQICWFGEVRGQRALMAVVMPVRMERYKLTLLTDDAAS